MSSISKHLSSMKAWVMAGKPYQSRLIPYEDEIFALRRRRPPMSYAQIAELLRQKYNFIIQRPAIFKFVKVRSRGRKEYVYSRNVGASATTPAPAAPQPAGPASRPAATTAVNTDQRSTNVEFRFTPSDRYNLTRLPPEEAAAGQEAETVRIGAELEASRLSRRHIGGRDGPVHVVAEVEVNGSLGFC